MKTLDIISLTLVIIGAINWGLIGFFRFDLVAALFGDMSAFTRVIYALVGIAGLYAISFYGRDRNEEPREEQ
ncbi:DUF378 domain-containing protein [Clostridium botulinum]|uniref:DUF378 domain-containing protein n=1 Tax=Clostridium botulinum TaxID=1491 RepID=UPI000472C670|nr:DUF378 domain-containing protein [Clostridium botulinum]APQ77697.1 hypothetical protein RSJ10_651 [Clostridium botulinum]AUM97935.1 DUF378 domain-containing protein [Clostridium botulinum]KEI77482.1 membrane protein [Clostridium botulinum A2 117]KEI90832.1 membrane protein [Clostridium botulinum B2 275]MBN3355271.1 DUF378 domain-containing protein [Clostridium botulinum]